MNAEAQARDTNYRNTIARLEADQHDLVAKMKQAHRDELNAASVSQNDLDNKYQKDLSDRCVQASQDLSRAEAE